MDYFTLAITEKRGAVERGSVDWPRDPGYDKIKALIEPLIDGEPLEPQLCSCDHKSDILWCRRVTGRYPVVYRGFSYMIEIAA